MPSWYPSEGNPVLGTFVREHARAAALENDVVVLYPHEQRLPEAITRQDGRHREILVGFDNSLLPRAYALRYATATTLGLRMLPPTWVPDVVHVHVAYPAALAAAVVRTRWRVPVVYTEQAGPLAEKLLRSRLGRVSVPLLARGAAYGAPVSRFLSEDLATHGLLPTRSSVLPNVVDTELFRPGAPRDITSSTTRLLAAALLVPGKGLEVAIRAVAELQARSLPTTLTIAGDGPQRQELEGLARRLQVAHLVTFAGLVSKPDLAEMCWEHDMFVMPSDRETFSAVVVEAMAAGLPVVATRCGGPEELVEPGTGLLVPRQDPAAIADAVVEVRRWPERFQKGRSVAEDRFSLAAVARCLDEIYSQACS